MSSQRIGGEVKAEFDWSSVNSSVKMTLMPEVICESCDAERHNTEFTIEGEKNVINVSERNFYYVITL